jgi:hypothetical protein
VPYESSYGNLKLVHLRGEVLVSDSPYITGKTKVRLKEGDKVGEKKR